MKSLLTALVIAASLPTNSAATVDHIMLHSRSGRVANTMTGFISIQPPTTPIRRAAAAATISSTIRLASTNAQDPTVAVVDAMPPALPPLKNHYYLLRHGQSTANVEGIISSARSLAGSTKHGLTPLGIQQGKDSAASLVDMVEGDMNNDDNGSDIPKSTKQVYFYSSPFARAKETAEACLQGITGNEEVAEQVKTLGLEVNDNILLDDGLMERFFGTLDGKELSTYGYVWPVDMLEPTNTAFDVESVAAVSTRIRSTLLDIDSQHDGGGNHIVLTSHADTLQIAQVYAAGLDNAGMFSQYRFGNGEVRRMGRGVDSLPEAVPLVPPKREE
mmetsp:Transcript_20776/g.38130  ORF Transcript_20776/g.38130 Transcript_20776/m.38130 type:complete len:331 (-) Transcript_20776:78-1070(-)